MGEKSGEGICYRKLSVGWSNIWFKIIWKEILFNKDCFDVLDDS